MYVIREMEDAILDCNAGCDTLECNDDAVHAWDEAVAFYVGSLNNGKLNWPYTLADKRCKNFGTCPRVNADILQQFKLGKDKLLAKKCTEAEPIKKKIVELISVPLVQGALRYAYKIGTEKDTSAKSRGEGATFAAAILPRVHACNSASASLISNNMKIDAVSPMKDGFAVVKKAFESAYSCMGMTCADVGGVQVSPGKYFAGAEPCEGVTVSFAGYTPATDVTQHSRIDLDQNEMEM